MLFPVNRRTLPMQYRQMYCKASVMDDLNNAYEQYGVRGIMEYCHEKDVLFHRNHNDETKTNFSPKELVQLAMEVQACTTTSTKTQRHGKEKAAAYLNSFIAICCQRKKDKERRDRENLTGDGIGNGNDDDTYAAKFALDLMDQFDSIASQLKPDIVTCALAYTATKDAFPDRAHAFLQRVIQSHPQQQVPPTTTVAERIRQHQQGTKRNDTMILGNSNLLNDHRWKEKLLYRYGISVLLDTDEFFIINKPSGLALSKPTTIGGGTNGRRRTKYRRRPTELCLEDMLLDSGVPLSCINPDHSRGFVHRLDIGTSGCLLIAKTNTMHAELISQFFSRQVQKSYVALVDTRRQQLQGQQKKSIVTKTNGASFSKGTKSFLHDDETVIDLPVGGRPAQSAFHIVERYGSVAAKIKVTTNQGRKHQVRIHCSRGLHSPIILDPSYGGENIMYKLNDASFRLNRAKERICLHASTLTIPDYHINVQAKVPCWWNEIIHILRITRLPIKAAPNYSENSRGESRY